MPAEGPLAQHQAWQTVMVRPGKKGLVLIPHTAGDQVDPDALLLMVNLEQRLTEPLHSRVGQQQQLQLVGANGAVHSIFSIDDPTTSTVRGFWGAGTFGFLGNLGAVTPIASGLSGRPLTAVPFYTTISDDPWLILADYNVMGKIRARDGLALVLGLAPPGIPTLSYQSILTTGIAAFDTSDQTQASKWTGAAGRDYSDTPIASGVPVISDTGGLSGSAIRVTTTPGSVAKGYWSIAGMQFTPTRNLSVLQGGAVAASDLDLTHLFMSVSRPDLVEEVRLYLVCSNGFLPTVLPGTSPDVNQDAYIKSFRPSDFTGYFEALLSALEAGANARTNRMVDDYLGNAPTDPGQPNEPPPLLQLDKPMALQSLPSDTYAAREPFRAISDELIAGRDIWTPFGSVGLPLRRGDWQRIGSTDGRDWSTILGLIVYIQTKTNESVSVRLDDFYLTGGYGPDSTEPGAQPYDVKVTHFDPRTGAEGNGSAEQPDTAHLVPVRQALVVTPPAHADGAMRQRAYVRGGTLNNNWYFAGQNSANGGQIVVTATDTELSTGETVPTDHDRPVSTVDNAGATVTAQPIPVIFGPLDDMILGCGDPYRPGTLYASLPGNPDAWPPDFAQPVCPASEELMNGLVWGGSGWVFSRERLYALYTNLVTGGGTSIRATRTTCEPGLAARYGMCGTPKGIAYVARDGVRLTQGGPSVVISDNIQPIFNKQTLDAAYKPINWAAPDSIFLSYVDSRLILIYTDATGARRQFRCDFLSASGSEWPWDYVEYADPISCIVEMRGRGGTPFGPALAGSTNAFGYLLGGAIDVNNTPIAIAMKTGDMDFGMPGPTKRLGDLRVDGAFQTGISVTTTLTYDNGLGASASQVITPPNGERRQYILDSPGTDGRARNVRLGITASLTEPASIHLLGASILEEPIVTDGRVTPWTSFPSVAYLTGVAITGTTFGLTKEVAVQVDTGTGAWTTVTTLAITHTARMKRFYSFGPVRATQVRLVPSNAEDVPWILYATDWLFVDEPPLLPTWDTYYTAPGDVYYTGLDVDYRSPVTQSPGGGAKQILVEVDGVALGPFTLPATDIRRVVHVTLPPGFGHIFRVYSADNVAATLYAVRWRWQEAPGEQTHWNQDFSTYGTTSDKRLKALVVRCDTNDVPVTLQIEVDGVISPHTVTVQADGPTVVMTAFPPIEGRIFRILPLGAAPGRCWEIEPIFDAEPLALNRWQTQRIDHGQVGWHSILRGYVTLRSTNPVTATLKVYNNAGTLLDTQTYALGDTAGLKVKQWLPFRAAKGVLYEWLFSVDDAARFYLYREESAIECQPWDGRPSGWIRPFGTDDQDHVRQRAGGPAIHEIPATAWIPPQPQPRG